MGAANRGKSETINIIREKIRGNGISLDGPQTNDCRESFTYNDKTIAICPAGDTKDIVEGNFIYVNEKNADIIITACRTKGKTKELVTHYVTSYGITSEEYKREYIDDEVLRKAQNEELATEIFNRL